MVWKGFNFALLVFGIGLLGSGTSIQAQDSSWVRTYEFGAYNQFDLRSSSSNAIATNRLLHDAFRKEITSNMDEKWGNITYGFFSFATTYLTMLWSHEFGHSLRARQADGEFRIHSIALPIPRTTMHLPASVSLVDEALSVTAGFEVNALNTRSIQSQFVAQNGIYNEDLAFSFANRLMYPLYTTVIVPTDPEDKDVWINTAGDPVHVALPVFKNYSSDMVFMPDSTVNPDLVSYYNQASIFGVLLNLLDINFYKEAGAAFGKNKTRNPLFLIGDHHTGWTYGTLFNVSPLGYELYLNNYIHINGNQFSLYYKYGRPFKNNGIGLMWRNFFQSEYGNLSARIDAWDQDIFSAGISGEILSEWKISDSFGLSVNAGYKTDGYVLGKQVSDGLNVGAGLVFYGVY